MIRHQISVLNQSSVMTDDEARLISQAFQVQVEKDFASVWGIGAVVSFVAKGQQPPPGRWWLVFLDNSDQAGALGYHDVTPEGLPMGKIFAGTDRQYGSKVSVTFSHEGLEMLSDPWINLVVQKGDSSFVAYENCDPCEDDGLAYAVKVGEHEVDMSDFVHPRYFDETAAGHNVQLDHCNHIQEPFQVLPGGYASVWTPGAGWGQIQGSQAAPGDRPRVGSRRERRRTPRTQWLVSDPMAQYAHGDSPAPLGSLPVGEEILANA